MPVTFDTVARCAVIKNMRATLIVIAVFIFCLVAGMLAGLPLALATNYLFGGMVFGLQARVPLAYKALMYCSSLYLPFLALTVIAATWRRLPGRGLMAGLAYQTVATFLFATETYMARGMEMDSRLAYALTLFVPAAVFIALGYVVSRRVEHLNVGGKMAHWVVIAAHMLSRLVMGHRKLTLFIAGLYAFTWIGGWLAHADAVRAQAAADYSMAQQMDREDAAKRAREGRGPGEREAFTDGPGSFVNWCVPVLPGILLADSGYYAGPTWGTGGVKIVLYWGLGTKEVWYLTRWIS